MMKAREALPSHAVPGPAFMQGAAHPQAATKLGNLGSGKMIQESRAKGTFQRGKCCNPGETTKREVVLNLRENTKRCSAYGP